MQGPWVMLFSWVHDKFCTLAILHERCSNMLLTLQGILSNICMMSLKRLPKHTKLLALQSFIWQTAACSCSTMASLMSLDHLVIHPHLVSWLSGVHNGRQAMLFPLCLLQSSHIVDCR